MSASAPKERRGRHNRGVKTGKEETKVATAKTEKDEPKKEEDNPEDN